MAKLCILPPKSTSQQAVLFCTSILLLIAIVLFLFYHVNYSFGYEGDDYVQTIVYHIVYKRDVNCFSLTYAVKHYFDLMVTRGYLGYFYCWFFELCNGAIETCRMILISLFTTSGFLLFFCLKRRLSLVAATVGALFYLVYFGKYHAIIAYNAEAYIFDLVIFIVILSILLSDMRYIIQAIVIGFLLWISLHFYEVLMITLPIYPLFWVFLRYKEKINWRHLMYAAIPCAVVGVHIFLLSRNPISPIWMRRCINDQVCVKFSLVKLLLIAFHNGLTTVVGWVHFNTLEKLVANFFTIDIIEQPLLLTFLFGLILLSAFFIWLNYKQEKFIAINNKPSRYCILLIITGAYLAGFAPIMASVIGLNMPSRLTFLPSLGVAILLAGLIDVCYKYKWLRQILIILFFSFSLFEAIGFCDIIRQAQSADEYDHSIINKMLSLQNVKIENGGSIFLSLSRHEKTFKNYWTMGPINPSMETGVNGVAWIWRAYHLPIDTIKYVAAARDPGISFEPEFGKWFQKNRHLASSKLYPFVIADNGQIKAITKIKIVDNFGGINKTISTALDEKVTAKQAIVIRFKQ